MTNRYRFITRWQFHARPEEVYAILSEPLEYPRWWPSVYLAVRQTGPGAVRLLTRGWLPYQLHWDARTVERRAPERLTIAASGDFEGRGEWSFVQNGESCDVTFDWKVTAWKPLLRGLTFLFRSVFEANHRWAMEQGRRSLELELARYRATTVEEMNLIPPPPRAADAVRAGLIAGAVLSSAVLAGIGKKPRLK